MSTPPSSEEAERRVERVLEESLERIESPRAAHAVVARVERLSAPIVEATPATLTPAAPPGPRAGRGRRLLKEALLRRMGPLNALDAEVYLAVNEGPHPAALDTIAWAVAMVTTGGWIWVIGALVSYLLRVPRSWVAVTRLVPSLAIATWLVEYPIKGLFRRRRPFVRVVQALVIGKKPGSWSFPSGHTASSFASAWILSSVWPRKAPAFYALAGLVGFSRIYVGAHYPGDVAFGAVLGMILSETVRRLAKRLSS
jgi:membrane-associated phospholipid phosphatase